MAATSEPDALLRKWRELSSRRSLIDLGLASGTQLTANARPSGVWFGQCLKRETEICIWWGNGTKLSVTQEAQEMKAVLYKRSLDVGLSLTSCRCGYRQVLEYFGNLLKPVDIPYSIEETVWGWGGLIDISCLQVRLIDYFCIKQWNHKIIY